VSEQVLFSDANREGKRVRLESRDRALLAIAKVSKQRGMPLPTRQSIAATLSIWPYCVYRSLHRLEGEGRIVLRRSIQTRKGKTGGWVRLWVEDVK
jgi:hypothetical protein